MKYTYRNRRSYPNWKKIRALFETRQAANCKLAAFLVKSDSMFKELTPITWDIFAKKNWYLDNVDTYNLGAQVGAEWNIYINEDDDGHNTLYNFLRRCGFFQKRYRNYLHFHFYKYRKTGTYPNMYNVDRMRMANSMRALLNAKHKSGRNNHILLSKISNVANLFATEYAILRYAEEHKVHPNSIDKTYRNRKLSNIRIMEKQRLEKIYKKYLIKDHEQ